MEDVCYAICETFHNAPWSIGNGLKRRKNSCENFATGTLSSAYLGLTSSFTGIITCASIPSITVTEKQTSLPNVKGDPSLAAMAPQKDPRRNGYISSLGRSEGITFWLVKYSTLKLPT